MIGIIVVGHGEFAKGLTSAVELIAGVQDKYITLDFTSDITPEQLKVNIKDAIDRLDNETGVLVFTDLMGGTPFKESVEISLQYDNVKVLTGTNIAMLLEAALMRAAITDVEEFTRNLKETGSSQVDYFDIASLDFDQDESDEDGI